ncbi:hypothetical protein JCM19241_1580 [Vibrio ishigakensis]|uniref:Uncharacterized protein n=1 Tax=Vibrio ishigakensis TaxID=1481914 RepID=A0A0B8QE12_9VIBR|nr:hypothetical protein JCM19241_1580 [Vibrio ishigakensis]
MVFISWATAKGTIQIQAAIEHASDVELHPSGVLPRTHSLPFSLARSWVAR